VKGFIFLLASSLALSVALGQAIRDPGVPNPVRASTRLQMLASVERGSVKLGEPIELHMHAKNVSSVALKLSHNMEPYEYRVIVTDASGAELPRTPLGRSMLTVEPMSFRDPVVLEPGAEDQEVVWDLAKIYELTRPGKYFVRAMFRGPYPAPGAPRPTTYEETRTFPVEEAVSDLIPFTITP
jgi:hypothetical protein